MADDNTYAIIPQDLRIIDTRNPSIDLRRRLAALFLVTGPRLLYLRVNLTVRSHFLPAYI
jgi:hypothetical protein